MASSLIRTLPMIVALLSFTAVGAFMSFGNGLVRWGEVVFLAAAVAVFPTVVREPVKRGLQSAARAFALSLVLAAIAVGTSWFTGRAHFFDDAGPVGGLLIVEFYVGLPTIIIALLFGIALGQVARASAR